jgi:hypothetical protein
MKRLAALAAILVLAASAAAPLVPRSTMATLERHFDRRLESFDINDPLYVIGATRGVYLEGYGVVLTSEVGLVATPNLTPFRATISEEDKAKLRQRKLARVPQVKRLMRDMLVQSANVLSMVPQQEQVAIAMLFFHMPWEDKSGLPFQVLMHAQRKALVDFEAGRMNEAQLQAAIKTEEF